MSELREEEQNMVNGGANYVRGYSFKVGDRVTDRTKPENGVGIVTKNVGVCDRFYIDEVCFPNVNLTYNVYEFNLTSA